MSKNKVKKSAQTTGHAWDGDIQEFNNPLPTWWLWGFYATVVFAFVYWIFYPAWPFGDSYTKGAFNSIEYVTTDGKQHQTHWNTRALYQREMQLAREQQAPMLEKIRQSSLEQILADKQQRGFAFSMAKVLFTDNCAACHQAGGAGIIGKYPNLADDSWLWGGKFAQIQETITSGRNGMMPSFKTALNPMQMDDVAEYVLSLSGHSGDATRIKRGAKIFNGQTGGCYYCHSKQGTGMQSLGSANLTDAIWTIADIDQNDTMENKREAIKQVISKGVSRKMPAWKQRLSEAEIKMLAIYVHELGGGT